MPTNYFVNGVCCGAVATAAPFVTLVATDHIVIGGFLPAVVTMLGMLGSDLVRFSEKFRRLREREDAFIAGNVTLADYNETFESYKKSLMTTHFCNGASFGSTAVATTIVCAFLAGLGIFDTKKA
jgi:hypothetical protein